MCLTKLDPSLSENPNFIAGKGYKVFEVKNGELFFQFYQHDGSRKVSENKWLTAINLTNYYSYTIRTDTGEMYRPGFHIYLTHPQISVFWSDSLVVEVEFKKPITTGWQFIYQQEMPCVVAQELFVGRQDKCV